MLPKSHILIGFLVAYIIYWFSSITIFQASLIFLSSVLIDFDHYLWYLQRRKDWNLKNAYNFLKKIHLFRHKTIMMIFHTIEFHIFIFILSYFFKGFFFIFLGMLFHSMIDIIHFWRYKMLKTREFSIIRYFVLSRKNPEIYLKIN